MNPAVAASRQSAACCCSYELRRSTETPLRGDGSRKRSSHRTFSRRTPETVLQPEPPDHEEGLAHDFPGHLGAALKPVGENDRHFDNLHSLAPELMGHFNLKTVPVGTHIVKVDGLEGAATKAFVTAGRVGERHSGDNPNVFGGAFAQHQS